MAVSPDCSLVVSTSKDGTIRFWELETAKEIKRLKWESKGEPDNAWFSPDATKLLVNGKNHIWRIYDIATCRALDLPGAKGKGQCAGFYPDRKSIIIREGRRWDYERAEDIWEVPGEYVTHSRGGRLFITNTKDGLVLWNGRTGKEVRKFGVGGIGAEFSPDSNHLLLKRPAGPAMYDVETCKELWRRDVPAALSGGFSPDSRTILYLGEMGPKEKKKHSALLFDARTGKRTGLFPLWLDAHAGRRWVRFVADGDCVLFSLTHGRDHMVFYDRRTGKKALSRPYHYEPHRLYCTVGPSHMLVPSDKAGTPNVFSLYGLR